MKFSGWAPVSRSRSRRRFIGVASTGAVLAALLAGVPASAASAADGGDDTPAPTLGAGRYIVMLRAPSAAAANTGSFDARSARVTSYRAQLRQSHTTVARQYGAKPVADFTAASNGFVADLSGEQAAQLSADQRVLLVEKSQTLKPDTWHSPKFLGLTGKNGAWTRHGGQAKAGAGIVVGDLDSGIWPESKSFAGARLTSKAKTPWDISRRGARTRMEKADGGVFRGECVIAEKWNKGDCNTKIISARYYGDSFFQTVPKADLASTDQVSARDGGGHGTHTASTAAGDPVANVSTEGRKFGAVSGMAPAARLAVYKVCWEAKNPDDSGCNNIDSVAAIDQAVLDGVDLLNFSVGGGASPTLDSVELAFEGAAEAGIFVSASAGNSGPGASTLDHPAPWLTTVAASTHVNFENTILLGNGKKLVGASISSTPVKKTRIVDSAKAAAAGSAPGDSDICAPDSLDKSKVRGKIVVCQRGVVDRVAKSAEVKRAGGKAMILVNPSENSLDADFHAVPTIHIADRPQGVLLNRYLAQAKGKATAAFLLGNQTKKKTPLPQVAGFSSRGPTLVSEGDLLKPDISAPGVSVLAAVAPPSNSHRKYDLYSGTSMAAPHITGLAAFIQGVHPTWTPMEIKSAMMTTAVPTKTASGKPSRDALAQGAGQVTPKRFFDPGLFVTSDANQWRGFLTQQGINTGVPAVQPKNINVPSMADGAVTSTTTFHRTFRATRPGVWTIKSDVPGFKLKTGPGKVRADRRGDLVDVRFVFTRTDAKLGRYAQGAVTLTGPTSVRLPVALKPVSVAAPVAVSGTGTTGSTRVALKAGFTGDLSVTARGLAKSNTVADSVEPGQNDLQCVTVTPNTSLAKFQVDVQDNTADLDLEVLQATACDLDSAVASAGVSGTASGDEAVTLRNPEPGTYIAVVSGFSAGTSGSPMAYDFDFWDVDPSATAGGLTVAPNPVPVRKNTSTSVNVSWSGLAAASKYLGFLTYPNSTDYTTVSVTTP
ncbi:MULTISPECIES: S8 family serine peptidase [unclassified Nocardioides]|uniref:S8 family serine peptidase n=1 Tax=unclassified Nocardioides TaxID=2615069 RepID=UPI000A433AC5|nr:MULTISPECIES: S8 family serine peptidase [unclassified Nocardioides]